jgi:phosphohistidine phosphatase
MSILYLVRHGEAQPDGPDSQRALTERGIDGVERVAAWAVRAGVSVSEIRHSGKRRAEQTAALLAARLHPAAGVHAIDGISPNDDPVAFAESIASEKNLMIVSHLPFLGFLAATLTGNALPAIAFRPATLVVLVRSEDRFFVDSVVHPEAV